MAVDDFFQIAGKVLIKWRWRHALWLKRHTRSAYDASATERYHKTSPPQRVRRRVSRGIVLNSHRATRCISVSSHLHMPDFLTIWQDADPIAVSWSERRRCGRVAMKSRVSGVTATKVIVIIAKDEYVIRSNLPQVSFAVGS